MKAGRETTLLMKFIFQPKILTKSAALEVNKLRIFVITILWCLIPWVCGRIWKAEEVILCPFLWPRIWAGPPSPSELSGVESVHHLFPYIPLNFSLFKVFSFFVQISTLFNYWYIAIGVDLVNFLKLPLFQSPPSLLQKLVLTKNWIFWLQDPGALIFQRSSSWEAWPSGQA